MDLVDGAFVAFRSPPNPDGSYTLYTPDWDTHPSTVWVTAPEPGWVRKIQLVGDLAQLRVKQVSIGNWYFLLQPVPAASLSSPHTTVGRGEVLDRWDRVEVQLEGVGKVRLEVEVEPR